MLHIGTEKETAPSARSVEHEITVAVPVDWAYGLIADVTQWPSVFPPTIHVEVLEQESLLAGPERIRIWATANGDVKTWTSRRVRSPEEHRIDFRQEVSAAPVASMSGSWVLEADGSRTRVRLLHFYSAVDDDDESLAWIDAAVDRNSRSELSALKEQLEIAYVSGGNRLLSFEDSVRIDGTQQDVYDFLNEAQLWVDRLPHVARVLLTEDSPGLQTLQMDTRTKDGSTHTTKSVRVCLEPGRIIYKQIGLPALMSLHTGRWTLVEDGDQLIASSQHTVVINEANIATVLGPGSDLARAREFVHIALSTNSLATLGLAKKYAESRTRGARR